MVHHKRTHNLHYFSENGYIVILFWNRSFDSRLYCCHG